MLARPSARHRPAAALPLNGASPMPIANARMYSITGRVAGRLAPRARLGARARRPRMADRRPRRACAALRALVARRPWRWCSCAASRSRVALRGRRSSPRRSRARRAMGPAGLLQRHRRRRSVAAPLARGHVRRHRRLPRSPTRCRAQSPCATTCCRSARRAARGSTAAPSAASSTPKGVIDALADGRIDVGPLDSCSRD